MAVKITTFINIMIIYWYCKVCIKTLGKCIVYNEAILAS